MATAGIGLLVAACGSAPRQDAGDRGGSFPVAVSQATFPASQQLAENTNLVISVRNTGGSTIPNIAVTLLNPDTGTQYATSAQAFSTLLAAQPGLAGRSRPVWIINQAPGPCGYSCQTGGPGGAVTAYSNTWALGRLKPGATATFNWAVTAVKSGTYRVEYQVAADLNGEAKAVTSSNQPVSGEFTVKIATKPRQAYVNNAGQIVYTSP